jgi:hypothetical protein
MSHLDTDPRRMEMSYPDPRQTFGSTTLTAMSGWNKLYAKALNIY